MTSIAPIVEGRGEEAALRCLIRRLTELIDPTRYVNVEKPFKQDSGKLLKSGGVENAVNATASRWPGSHILILLDCDDGCAKAIGPTLCQRARAARPDVSVSVVLPVKEFECWLIAGAGALGGRRGLKPAFTPPADPESIRDAKRWLRENMS
ncbi:MAG: DUF4276 family protein [Bryobacteraceae bacterium]|nr:DUF4276 family protein [Bryobacteraceae bacterium]